MARKKLPGLPAPALADLTRLTDEIRTKLGAMQDILDAHKDAIGKVRHKRLTRYLIVSDNYVEDVCALAEEQVDVAAAVDVSQQEPQA